MHKVLGIVLAILITSTSALAQRNGNSPYSRFGIGDQADNSFMHLRHMGSASTAYLDPYHINVDNPASYAALRSTAFDIGIGAKRAILEDTNGNQSNIWSGNMEYLSLAFPLQNDLNQLLDRAKRDYRLGMAFTLAPASTVAYNIESTTTDPIDGDIVRNYNGSGGSYKFLWGVAGKYKDFSLGTNLGYQLGKINYERRVEYTDVPFAYDDVFSNSYTMSGFLLDLGAMYDITLNKKEVKESINAQVKSLVIGLTYKNRTNLTTTSTLSQTAIQRGVGAIDTGSIVVDSIGAARLPGALGIGVAYRHGNKFMISLDYKTSDWTGYFNEASGEVKETLKRSSSVSLGGFYRPNYKSFTSYWKRVYYRYGFTARQDPRLIGGDQISDYAFTAGLGMPFVFQRKISHGNLGIEVGKRAGGTALSEAYCKFTFGFTFNDDEWFLKRKYN